MNKIKKRFAILTLLICFIGILTIHKNVYADSIVGSNQDIAPPTVNINSISMDKKTVNGGETIKITVSAQDDLSGVAYISIKYVSPLSSSPWIPTIYKDITLADNHDGTYSGYLQTAQYDLIGEWRVCSITCIDKVGNKKIAYNRLVYPYDESVSLYAGHFWVQGTRQDITSPTVSVNSIIMDKKTVNGGETIKITVGAQDDLSGVDYMSIRYVSPLSSSPWIPTIYKDITLADNHDGTYSGYLQTAQYDLIGEWRVRSITCIDKVGNKKIYDDMLSLYSGQFWVQGTRQDITPPTVNINSISMDKKTVNGGETIKITVSAQDDLSGVAYISIKYVSPLSSSPWIPTIYKDITLADNHDGTYSGYLQTAQYDLIGEWRVRSITCIDKVGNKKIYDDMLSLFSGQFWVQGTIPIIHPTSVSLDKTDLNLLVGDSYSIIATVYPIDASNRNVSWVSDNTLIAVVDGAGKVTAVGPGSTTIRALTEDQNKMATIVVTVIEPDITPPQLLINPKGGIYNFNISIEVSSSEEADIYCTLDGSEPSESSERYSNPLTLDKDTMLKVMAIDKAGNKSEIYTENYVIDKTAPSTSINLDGTLGENEWFKTDVIATLSSEDNIKGSGIAKTEYSFDGVNWNLYVQPLTISTEGITKLYYKSTDKATNIEIANIKEIKIDKSAPSIYLNGFENGAKIVLGSNVSVYWVASDLISGLTSTSIGSIDLDTSTVGKHTNIITVIDKAGNTTNFQLTYYIIYQYSGVMQPIKLDGTSIFKLKSTIPIKFSLTDINNNFISNAVAKIYINKISNNVSEDNIAIEIVGTVASEGNEFRYDYTDNQYIFNLSTKKLSLTEGMYKIKIELADQQSYTTNLSLR